MKEKILHNQNDNGLIKNKNFLNNQNYILGNRLVDRTLMGISTYVNDENIVGFCKDKKIQIIGLDKIMSETGKSYLMGGFIILFLIFTILSILKGLGLNDSIIGFIASVLILGYIFLLFSFKKPKHYKVYKYGYYIIINNLKL